MRWILAACVIGLASAARAQAPKMPLIRPFPCDGYCRPDWASCARINLFERPDSAARVAAVVDSGKLVKVIDGQVRTTVPGIVVAQKGFTYTKRFHGADEDFTPKDARRWRFAKGDTIYIIDEDSDGDSERNWIWMYRTKRDTSAEFWSEGNAARANALLVQDMVQSSWRRVRTSDGRTGWTQYGDKWTGTSYYDDPVSKCVAK